MNQINNNIKFKDNLINSKPHLKPEITECEKKIIQFIGDGSTNKEIALKLNMNIQKINKTIEKLLTKTDSRNLAHLMMFAAINNVLV